jgi:hypothetical protein
MTRSKSSHYDPFKAILSRIFTRNEYLASSGLGVDWNVLEWLRVNSDGFKWSLMKEEFQALSADNILELNVSDDVGFSRIRRGSFDLGRFFIKRLSPKINQIKIVYISNGYLILSMSYFGNEQFSAKEEKIVFFI